MPPNDTTFTASGVRSSGSSVLAASPVVSSETSPSSRKRRQLDPASSPASISSVLEVPASSPLLSVSLPPTAVASKKARASPTASYASSPEPFDSNKQSVRHSDRARRRPQWADEGFQSGVPKISLVPIDLSMPAIISHAEFTPTQPPPTAAIVIKQSSAMSPKVARSPSVGATVPAVIIPPDSPLAKKTRLTPRRTFLDSVKESEFPTSEDRASPAVVLQRTVLNASGPNTATAAFILSGDPSLIPRDALYRSAEFALDAAPPSVANDLLGGHAVTGDFDEALEFDGQAPFGLTDFISTSASSVSDSTDDDHRTSAARVFDDASTTISSTESGSKSPQRASILKSLSAPLQYSSYAFASTGSMMLSSNVASSSSMILNYLPSGACTPSLLPPMSLDHAHTSMHASPDKLLHQQLSAALTGVSLLSPPASTASLFELSTHANVASAVPMSIPCSPTLTGMRML